MASWEVWQLALGVLGLVCLGPIVRALIRGIAVSLLNIGRGLIWAVTVPIRIASWFKAYRTWKSLYVDGLEAMHRREDAIAVEQFEAALKVAEAFSPGEFYLAETMLKLGTIYHRLGKCAEAESLFREALAINEENFGPEDESVGDALNSLAELYQDQGNFAEAERHYRRALAIAKRRHA